MEGSGGNGEYMVEHGIPQLFDEILSSILQEKPGNVLEFMQFWIENYKRELTMPVHLYYHPFSQPSRAVLFFVRHNHIPCEEHIVDIVKGEGRAPQYIENVNAFGGVPAIIDDDLQLSEGAAILSYLASKYRLEKYYPSNTKRRAQVDRMMHWHHSHLRLCTTQLVLPVLTALVRGDPDPVSKGDFSKVEPHIKFLEKLLSKQNYVAGDTPTIADFFSLTEVDQLAWAGFLDLERNVNIRRWLAAMQQMEGYSEVTGPREQLVKCQRK